MSIPVKIGGITVYCYDMAEVKATITHAQSLGLDAQQQRSRSFTLPQWRKDQQRVMPCEVIYQH